MINVVAFEQTVPLNNHDRIEPGKGTLAPALSRKRARVRDGISKRNTPRNKQGTPS